MLPVTPSPPMLANRNAESLPPRLSVHVPRRKTALLAIFSVLLFIVATSGWLVLHGVPAGSGGVQSGAQIRLNWTAILALGVPLAALAFLVVWLFSLVALWQNPRDTSR